MKNIVLIGMPGCGKSTVGVILAKTLGTDFLDTDLVIQKRENALLQQILNTRGLEAFLDAEEAAVCSTVCTGTVIATGGSVIYREAAMRHLAENGVIVYLELCYEEMMHRLNNIKTRGIALPEGQTMAGLFAERTPLYERYAQITVSCGGCTPEEVVTSLTGQLRDLL